MNEKHQGSCLCGRVKFEIDGGFESFFLCHCKHCQKDTGSAFAANLFSTKSKLNWVAGQDTVKTFVLPNTRHTKSFCSECSSALPNIQMDGKLLVVPAGSLNTEVTTQPTAHIFCSSKANWEDALATAKKFETFPG
jgi:hypothetical protein